LNRHTQEVNEFLIVEAVNSVEVHTHFKKLYGNSTIDVTSVIYIYWIRKSKCNESDIPSRSQSVWPVTAVTSENKPD